MFTPDLNQSVSVSRSGLGGVRGGTWPETSCTKSPPRMNGRPTTVEKPRASADGRGRRHGGRSYRAPRTGRRSPRPRTPQPRAERRAGRRGGSTLRDPARGERRGRGVRRGLPSGWSAIQTLPVPHPGRHLRRLPEKSMPSQRFIWPYLVRAVRRSARCSPAAPRTKPFAPGSPTRLARDVRGG